MLFHNRLNLMRWVVGSCLLTFVAACGNEGGLSSSKVESLVQAHWERQHGIHMTDLSYACSAGNPSPECVAAAECLVATAVELEQLDPSVIRVANRPDADIVMRYFPAFTARRVRVAEVSEHLAEGISPGQQVRETAQIEVSLAPSPYVGDAVDCPGFADFFATLRQPTIMSASLVGAQVNRGSGIEVEWSVRNVYALRHEQR